MSPVFFIESEARTHVGERVEALMDFPSVPARTSGIVTRALKRDAEGWVVRVEWELPRRQRQYFATVLNFSFNFQTQSNPVTDEFSKAQFERLVISADKRSLD